MNSIAFSYYLARRSNDYWARQNAARDAKRMLRQQYAARPKGRGNRAWKRVEALSRCPDSIIWPCYLR
jgi:hypothetical protein